MKLYFENSQGVARQIAECKTEQDVITEIHKFVDNCNKGKPKTKQFKSYYTRTWIDDGKTWFDIGSWSEYFYVDKELNHAK